MAKAQHSGRPIGLAVVLALGLALAELLLQCACGGSRIPPTAPATVTPSPAGVRPVTPSPAPSATVELPTLPPAPALTPVPLSPLPPLEGLKLLHPPPVPGARLLLGRYAEPQGYYLLDLETGEEVRWPPFPEEQAAGAPGASLRPSPTGERILYTLWNGMAPPGGLGIGSVWSMSPDGSDKRQLAASDERTYPVGAIWSPDGREIAYLRVAAHTAQAAAHEQPAELWVMNADGSGQRMLARLPYTDGRQGAVRWLLDDHIYLITLDGDLLRVSPRTGAVTRLAEGIEVGQFVISPGTEWIVVQDPVMGEDRIVSLGRRPLRLPSDLAWDPDGQRVAYIRGPEAGTAEGIWVRALASGEEKLLAHIRTSEMRWGGMAWSPDGQMLAYEAQQGVYLLDVDTGAARLAVPDPYAGLVNPPYQRGVEFVAWVSIPAGNS